MRLASSARRKRSSLDVTRASASRDAVTSRWTSTTSSTSPALFLIVYANALTHRTGFALVLLFGSVSFGL